MNHESIVPESVSALQSGHIPVLLDEALDALNIQADGRYVDATYGGGGHSRAILGRLSPKGRLLAMDRDLEAVAAGRTIDDSRFSLFHLPFSKMGEALLAMEWAEEASVDGILLDIGVSSTQLDSGRRGFSFKFDAPIDMRMDATRGETVGQWLARAGQEEIAEVIHEYGEERFAHAIAKKIVAVRSQGSITNTGQLAEIIRSAVHTREPGKDAATRSFQAFRIHINQELEELSLVLPQAERALKPGGRLVAISFHSLEDRIVKRYFQAAAHPESRLPKGMPLKADQLPPPRLALFGKAVRPSLREVSENPRARSAIMRVAQKCAPPLNRNVGAIQ